MLAVRPHFTSAACGALVLVACHHREFRIDIMPPPGPISNAYTVRVMNVAGARKPGPAPVIAARCEDPAICSTQFADNEVTIIPLHPGTTRVVVDAKNTVYGDVERHAFEVVVR